MDERRGRPLLLIDIAVPRDIDPACARPRRREPVRHRRPPGGDRRSTSRRARRRPRGRTRSSRRRSAASRAGSGQLDALPTVAALHERGESIVEQVLAENAGRWEAASSRDLAARRSDARGPLPRACCTSPTIRLRSLGERAAATPAWRSCASCSACRDDSRRPSAQQQDDEPAVRTGARPPPRAAQR